jgi:hypothetical protein
LQNIRCDGKSRETRIVAQKVIDGVSKVRDVVVKGGGSSRTAANKTGKKPSGFVWLKKTLSKGQSKYRDTDENG